MEKLPRGKASARLILFICMAVNILDGYDIVAASITGPFISEEWGLASVQLGLFFAGVPVGMALGAMILSSLSDYCGRRAMLIAALVAMSIGMGLSSVSDSLTQIGLTRVLTGIGVGGAVAIVNTMGAEAAPPAHRSLWISLVAIGVPLGLTVGSAIAIPLLNLYGWRSIYVTGAAGSALLIVAVAIVGERSPDGAAAQSPRPAKPQLGNVLHKPYAAYLGLTSFVFFAIYLSTYFLVSWTPKILASAGLSMAQGAESVVLLTSGGMLGAALFGLTAGRIGIHRSAPAIMVFAFVAASVVSTLSPQAGLLPLTFLVGFGMSGSNAAMYAALPAIFPTHIRGTATGFAFGLGRFGAIVGPVAGGLLVDSGLGRFALTVVMTIPFLIGGIVLYYVLASAGRDADALARSG